MTAPRLGFVIPYCGFPHQEYVKTRFAMFPEGEAAMICFRQITGGWTVPRGLLHTLAPEGVFLRAADKAVSILGRAVRAARGRGTLALVPPLGWKGRFFGAVEHGGIGALMAVYGGTGVAFLPLFERLGLPIAVSIEGSDAQMADHSPWYAERLKALWARADLCIFVSRFLLRQAVERGFPEEKGRVIYNSTDIPDSPADFRKGGDLGLISVANFHPVKGHRFLLEGFALALGRFPHMRLTLVGKGPLEQELKNRAAGLGIAHKVRFTGSLPKEAVCRELRSSDLFVQASVRADDGQEEGFALSALEAQANGLPAIVTASGGMPEVVEDGMTGYVVPERDPSALAEAICTLAGDSARRLAFAGAAYRRAREKFSVSVQAAALLRVRDELCGVSR